MGTGVVFSEDGMIFTNLHVIAGAEKVGVVFFDGTESDVDVLNVQPENDLAILKAKTLPDDLRPATLRSTRGLQTGDEVLAVGFPFGIGPTATFGVVSGLRREHYSEEGQQEPDRSHPIRCRRQPRQLGRAPGHARGRRGGHRHLDLQSHRRGLLRRHRLRRAHRERGGGGGRVALLTAHNKTRTEPPS